MFRSFGSVFCRNLQKNNAIHFQVKPNKSDVVCFSLMRFYGNSPIRLKDDKESSNGDVGDIVTTHKNPARFNVRERTPVEKMKAGFGIGVTERDKTFPGYVDVVVIGGGVIGASIAYHLKARTPPGTGLNVALVERDPAYTRASTVLSVGGLRQQFSLPENIAMSLYGAEFLRNSKKHLAMVDSDPPDVQFQPHGYLFLATEAGAEQMLVNHRLQTELGAKIELLTANKLKDKFPWINTDNVELASYGLENEGWFDPWALLEGFRRKAISLGVEYVKGEAVGFETEYSESSGIPAEGYPGHERLKKLVVKMEDGELRTINFAIAIIACGPQSGEVARLAGIGTGTGLLQVPLPVEPRKRYVYVYHCPDGPGLDCPLTVDTTGTYFRREGLGGHYVAGKSPLPHEEPGDLTNLDVDYAYFDQQVWPTLASRVPAFENLKLKSAWAGFYDYNTLDQNPVIGYHPYHNNLLFATGFSGHGIQHAPAAGRAVMELVIDSDFKTINLSRFGFDRVIEQRPIPELNIW